MTMLDGELEMEDMLEHAAARSINPSSQDNNNVPSQPEPDKPPAPPVPGEGSKNGGLKVCTRCKKQLPLQAFDARESRCKGCRSLVTSFERRYKHEHGVEALKQLKADEHEFNSRIRIFAKHAPQDSTNYNRRKLGDAAVGALSIQSKAEASTGVRGFTQTKMMWEGEWLEEAQKAYLGRMTVEEAQRQWNVWKNNPKWPRDRGPYRGYLQLEIPVGKFKDRYDDFHTGKVLTGQARSKKKATQEDFGNMVASLTSGADTWGGATDKLQPVFDKFSQSVADEQRDELLQGGSSWHSVGESVFAREGLMMTSMEEIEQEAQVRKKKGPQSGSDDVSGADGDGDDGLSGDQPNSSHGSADMGHVDSLNKCSQAHLPNEPKVCLLFCHLCVVSLKTGAAWLHLAEQG